MAVAHGNVGGLLAKHDYKEIRKVGEGSFGKAILVQGRDGAQLICKMVDVSKASRKEMQDAVKEGQLLAELKHPYIVRYRENFTEAGWLCILMDFCEGGDLTKQIEDTKKRRNTLGEDQVLKWFTQGVMALKYIHDKHILHRDLKPSNFFLSKSGNMKMGDFGIAKVLACTIAVAKTQIGTPYYLSPELCKEKPYTWPSDIWAMGCILYEMCALKVPFDAPSIAALVQKITTSPVPPCPRGYSPFTAGLVSELLTRNPDQRPSSGTLLERPKIKAIVDMMVNDANATGVIDVAPRKPASRAPSQDPGGGPSEVFATGDLVEYWSNSHKDWLPAVVNKVDGNGGIIIDLKPNTWMPKDEQQGKVRRRRGAGAAPGGANRPSSQAGRSPSVGRQPSARDSPSNARRPSNPGVQDSPRTRAPGAANNGRPGSRAASPMHRSPSVGSNMGGGEVRPSSRGGAAAASPRGQGGVGGVAYRKGDLVEYYSTSHKDWLPAVVSNVDGKGGIIIDLKPNTWVSKEEQQGKIRPRVARPGGGGYNAGGAGSRQASPRVSVPGVQRSPSTGSVGGGVPPPHRAPSPSGARAPSPRVSGMNRVPSRQPSPRGSRAPSPSGGVHLPPIPTAGGRGGYYR